MNFRRFAACVITCCGLAGGARAEVVESLPTGFMVRMQVLVRAPAARIYDSLVRRICLWWDPAHTWSGDSANLSLDARPGGCFCERLPGGGVSHLTVVYAAPGKMLRLSGALGPLQDSGVAGSLTWTLSPTDTGTMVDLSYSVGGYRNGGLIEMASPVDEVLNVQLQRPRRYVETGRPEPR
jgi:uncharacterized protein YndB with AHSA1/START domain